MSTAQRTSAESPRQYKLFIDGKWVDAESGKTFQTPNPATGATLAEVAEADAADVDKAVAAARKPMKVNGHASVREIEADCYINLRF